MGCDIHFYVEKRDGNAWVAADEWREENDGDEESPDIRLRTDWNKSFYSGRNYDLFAILANVRNGRGFAGIKTGEGFNPICEPKGLPEDVSSEVRRASDEYGCDGHSHSWHTVADILSFDWTQATGLTGVVDFANYELFDRWREDGPKEWCGGVSGPAVNHVNETQMKTLVEEYRKLHHGERAAFLKQHENTYCQITWGTSYHKAAGNFWSDTIPRLLRVGKPEDVRIVFWFDN